MIEQHEAMPILIQACPSFAAVWAKHLEEHGNDLFYAAAGAFAHHLLALNQNQSTLSFPAVAAAIERLQLEGSAWVKEFATVGVLEDIQNVWSNASEDPESFGQLLGPEGQRKWRALNKFWSGKPSNVAVES